MSVIVSGAARRCSRARAHRVAAISFAGGGGSGGNGGDGGGHVSNVFVPASAGSQGHVIALTLANPENLLL